MSIHINTRQAYSEIDEFLSLLTDEYINKIPKYLRDFFYREKDKNYTKGISITVPIKDQNLKKETLAIIALLNLEYWCDDQKEKERLREVYAKNQQVYNELSQIEFNAYDIFNNKSIFENQQMKQKQTVIPYKDTIIKRIINDIKKIFASHKK